MGYEMLVGPEDAETEAYYLGSGTTVGDFMGWAASLPADDYPVLTKFAAEFQTTDGAKLADEIIAALAPARRRPGESMRPRTRSGLPAMHCRRASCSGSPARHERVELHTLHTKKRLVASAWYYSDGGNRTGRTP